MRIVNGLDELEQLNGARLGYSRWMTVTPTMVRQFSDLTGDHQWIHLDAERAARELEVGGPIVQGLLTLSLVVRFRQEIVQLRGVDRVINYGFDRVRFPAPVRVGSRIRASETVSSTRRTAPDALRLATEMTIEAEDAARPACVAETVSLVYATGAARG